MEKQVTIVSPNAYLDKWYGLLEVSPYRSWFQSPHGFSLYDAQPYLDAFAIGVMENDQLMGVVVGFIQAEKGLKSFFSRRAIINGGLLLHPSISQNALQALLQALKKRTRKAIYVEIRNLYDYSPYATTLAQVGFAYQPHLNIKITCDTWHQALKRMDNNRYRVLSKPMPQGLTHKMANCPAQVKAFYHMLQKHYQQKVRKPLFPYAFFETMIMGETGKLLLLYKDDKLIGGMALLYWPNTALYDYYACALDDEYRDLSPSVWLYGLAIQYAIQHQLPVFDTMGAGVPEIPYGVRDFKLRFGGQLVQEGRFLCIHKPFLYKLGESYIRYKSKE